MSGGGLTKGDLKRERSSLRVYTCFGRSPEGSFWIALAGSSSASCKLDFAYLSTRALIAACSSSIWSIVGESEGGEDMVEGG